MDQPLTILLVDDDPAKLESLKARLDASPAPRFCTTAFSCPYEAFDWLDQNAGAVEFAFIDHVFTGVLRPPGRDEMPSLTSGVDLRVPNQQAMAGDLHLLVFQQSEHNSR